MPGNIETASAAARIARRPRKSSLAIANAAAEPIARQKSVVEAATIAELRIAVGKGRSRITRAYAITVTCDGTIECSSSSGQNDVSAYQTSGARKKST